MMIALQAYEAALKNAAYYVQDNVGFLRLRGADRLDFLQRQTTNDLRLLTAEQTVSTVLTSPTARILDVLRVIEEGESLGVIPLSGRASETSTFLRKRIFFSDQVSIDDLSADFDQMLIMGPKAANGLRNLGVPVPKLGQLVNSEIDRQPATVIAHDINFEVGYRILTQKVSSAIILEALDNSGVVTISSDIFEILRVEAGKPGSVNELTDAYTPLEVQLQDMISDSKGCYTGQEIIARQITYDKVTKILVGIRLSNFVEAGVNLEFQNKSVGTLTSVVQSPRFGPIGLGIIRRPYHEIGTNLSIQNEAVASVEGVVAELPFR